VKQFEEMSLVELLYVDVYTLTDTALCIYGLAILTALTNCIHNTNNRMDLIDEEWRKRKAIKELLDAK
jgi:hypothetical protein